MNGCLFVVVVLFFTVIWLAFLSVSTFVFFCFILLLVTLYGPTKYSGQFTSQVCLNVA